MEAGDSLELTIVLGYPLNVAHNVGGLCFYLMLRILAHAQADFCHLPHDSGSEVYGTPNHQPGALILGHVAPVDTRPEPDPCVSGVRHGSTRKQQGICCSRERCENPVAGSGNFVSAILRHLSP